MRTELEKIFNFSRLFNIQQTYKQSVKYTFKDPCRILLNNIYSNWLQSIWSKTNKTLLVYLNRNQDATKTNKMPFGYIEQHEVDYNNVFQQDLNESSPKEKSELIFNLIVPEQDSMQYFIQWQRYRKYWWSSITTTPSLFGIGDIKHGENIADVNIVAKFSWGSETVEVLNMKCKENSLKNAAHLSCKISLENALFILLLDGVTNSTKEGYLRLHRCMAPYQISFALDYDSKSKEALGELAVLLHGRLANKSISSWLPDFSLSMESQVSENLKLGVAYTAVLSETTLTNGIFHLLNCSTMLKEQVHIADFDTYAALICKK